MIDRSIEITPATAIRVVRRTDEWNSPGSARPGWASHTIRRARSRKVTVTIDDDRRSVAVVAEVVRPSAR